MKKIETLKPISKTQTKVSEQNHEIEKPKGQNVH